MAHKAKSHGTTTIKMSASPSTNSDNSSAVERGKRRTSGHAYTTTGSGGGDEPPENDPVFHVKLNRGTIIKLVGPAILAILGVMGTLVVFYFSTETHLKDNNIHLKSDERAKLETKAAATLRVKRIIRILKRESKLTRREISVQQKEQINKATKKLEKKQDAHYHKILNEVRRTRRAVRRAQ